MRAGVGEVKEAAPTLVTGKRHDDPPGSRNHPIRSYLAKPSFMTDQHYAGFWRRVLATLVDTLILWIPCSIFSWQFAQNFNDPTTLAAVDFIQTTLIWTAYYGILESSQKAGTFGKQIVGLRVSRLDGQPLTFARASSRFLVGVLSGIPLGIGIFMVGWTAKKQGLHDIICGCIVVRNFAR